MPYANSEQRKSWSANDYNQRLTEMREEYLDLPEKNRDSDEYNKAKESLKREQSDLDFEYRIVRALAPQESPIEAERRAQYNPSFTSPESAMEQRTAGELVVEGWKDWLSRGHTETSPVVELNGPFRDQWRQNWQSGYEQRALVDSSTTSNLLRPVVQPVLHPQNMYQTPLFVRDIIPSGQTTASSVRYLMELNSLANQGAASTVAEGGVKPEATIEFDEATALIQTIAVTMPITNQMFDDLPAVVSYINTRLSYMVAYREEFEFLNGNGVSPDLKGLLTYSGIQTQTYVTNEIATSVLKGATKVRAVFGNPTAVIMHPNDYVNYATHRAAGGSGTFDGAAANFNAPYGSVPATVWGLPVVQTANITAGTALVGDFRMAAQIWDRSGVEVRTFEQHADYVVKNKRLVRAEERVGLAVYRPDYLCQVAVA